MTYLQIIYLPCNNSKKDDGLDDRPPFDSVICRLSSITMYSFPKDDIFLFILDRLETVRQIADFPLDRCNCSWILGRRDERVG